MEEMAQKEAKDKEEKTAETQIRAEDKEEKKAETECPRARAVEPPLVPTKRFASPPSFPRHVAAPSGSHRRTFPLSWNTPLGRSGGPSLPALGRALFMPSYFTITTTAL
jgi:hypothetical protein